MKLSFRDFEERAKRAKKELKCKAIIIDSLQHFAEAETGDPTKLEALIRSLKNLARKLKVTLVATSRLWPNPTSSTILPVLLELGDWESLEEHADVIALVSEDPEDTTPFSSDKRLVLLRILKNENGSTGTVRLVYSKEYRSYKNLEYLMTDALDSEESTE